MVEVHRRFDHDARSVAEARHFVTRFLAGDPPEVGSAAEMMVSELATNCLLHTESDFSVLIRRFPDRVRVEVADDGKGRPFLPPIDPTAMSGRGLRTVDTLSVSWGVDNHRDGPGKTVWFVVTTSAARKHQ
jgi:anti-sigma regulatory factor (Ser/Thr protein kinase)